MGMVWYKKSNQPKDWQSYEVYGIDVSAYQKNIHWEYVKKEGIDFAFIKATEGKSILDKNFKQNWEGCKEHNIIRGAYHYYHSTVPWQEQYRWIVKQVNLSKGDLPLVLDIEEYDFFHHKKFIQDLKALTNALTKHYACKPILYSHMHFYNKHLHQHFPEHYIWIAKYDDEKPVLKDQYPWHFWQYTDKGNIQGIPFYIDMNCFIGNRNELLLMRKK